MTLSWLMQLYEHYKTDYDFKLSGVKYADLQEQYDHENECLPW